MKPLFAAIRFLTVIPLPQGLSGDEQALSRSGLFFPIIGLLIGIMAALLNAALTAVIPQLPAGILLVVFLVAISGGLHMDGLADTADGFFSVRPRERVLDIMRDSRIGAMGVMAMMSVFFLKIGLVVSLPPELFLPGILLMPVAGRCALVVTMQVLPYARSEGGLASLFQTGRSRILIPWAMAFLAIAGLVAARWAGLAAAVASIIVMMGLAEHSRHKIGGYTGDTLGAACEIVELVPPFVLLICLRYGITAW